MKEHVVNDTDSGKAKRHGGKSRLVGVGNYPPPGESILSLGFATRDVLFIGHEDVNTVVEVPISDGSPSWWSPISVDVFGSRITEGQYVHRPVAPLLSPEF